MTIAAGVVATERLFARKNHTALSNSPWPVCDSSITRPAFAALSAGRWDRNAVHTVARSNRQSAAICALLRLALAARRLLGGRNDLSWAAARLAVVELQEAGVVASRYLGHC